MASTQNLQVYAGDSTVFHLTLTQYDGFSSVNLVGVQDIAVLFKRVLADPDPVAYIAKKVSLGGVAITNAALGQIDVTLAPADTSLVVATLTLQYAAKVYFLSGQEVTGCIGTLTITPTVVRGI